MLTLKQKKFIAKYIETGNATEAVTNTYRVKNRNVAGVIGYENLRKLKIKQAIEEALEVAGITDDFLASRLKMMIDAGIGIDATAQTSYKCLEMVAKLKGLINI